MLGLCCLPACGGYKQLLWRDENYKPVEVWATPMKYTISLYGEERESDNESCVYSLSESALVSGMAIPTSILKKNFDYK